MKRFVVVTAGRRLLLAATLALLGTGAAQAQKLRPGLWENNFTVKGGEAEAGMARMQQELARLPPEQRAQVEAMMAQRGVGVSPGGPGAPGGAGGMGGAGAGMSMKFCLTPEQAAREEIPQREGRCTQTSKERRGNTLRFKFACEGEPQVSGEGEYTLVSDKELNGNSVVNTVRRGQPTRMEVQTRARWLGADCGDIKPVTEALRPGAASSPRAPKP